MERAGHLRDARRHVQRPREGEPGTFQDAIERLGHLARLGVNAVQVMPAAEFAGDVSWGYNPAHIFAVESSLRRPGGRCKAFVDAAHARGIAVILDVVYNHFGPSDLDLWQFDGWSGERQGRHLLLQRLARRDALGRHPPRLRPRRGAPVHPRQRAAVARRVPRRRPALRHDALHPQRPRRRATAATTWPRAGACCSGSTTRSASRFPGTHHHRRGPAATTPRSPPDRRRRRRLRRAVGRRVRPPDPRGADRAATTRSATWRRSPTRIAHRYNGDAFQRVVYTGVHDEVANGKRARPARDRPGRSRRDCAAQKRSTLGGGAGVHRPRHPDAVPGPGVPAGRAGSATPCRSTGTRARRFRGIVRLYRDLIRLRLNRGGFTRGLTGRARRGPPHRRGSRRWSPSTAGTRRSGRRRRRRRQLPATSRARPTASAFRGPATGGCGSIPTGRATAEDFTGQPSGDAEAIKQECDGHPWSAEIAVGTYSVLIFSQDRG